jgi:cell division protein FtsI (penicillin-binding protein 3)
MAKPKNNVRRAPRRPASSTGRQPRAAGQTRPDRSRLKLALVGGLFALAWLGLWARAYYVQIVMGPDLALMARRQHEVAERITGARGEIFDRAGRLLAKSVEFTSVYARPLQVKDAARAEAVLAETLGLPRREVRAKLRAKANFVWIARQVGDKPAAALRRAGLVGVHLTTEYGRQYPNRHLAGQLLGFVGLDDKGLEGLEASFDDLLAGHSSKLVVQRDAAGRKLHLDNKGQKVDIHGRDIRLTIDAHIQFAAEEALERAVTEHQGRWGGCLVVEVSSGEILAWAEYPFFNPNAFERYGPGQWRNRMAGDAFEFGSTVKPFVIAAALQEGLVDLDTEFFCEEGRWRYGGKTISDTHEYGDLPVHKVLRYSSNICSAKIAVELGKPAYHAYLQRLGFGEKTGLPLPGEARGILRPAGEWYDIDLATAAFGQGFSATAVQMARAYLCLANGGVLKPLKLALEPEPEPAPQRRVFSSEVTAKVLATMRDVVQEDGTGTRARIQGLEVGGKTGTAQKASPKGGYGDKYMASFVGMFPATQPKYLVLVVVDEPRPHHYGGVVAAPAFKETAMKTLAYKGRLPDVAEPLTAEQGGGDEPEISVASGPVTEPRPNATAPDDGGAVPDLVGLSLRTAVEILAERGIVPVLKGEGLVVARQQPAAGRPLQNAGEGCTLWLGDSGERS